MYDATDATRRRFLRNTASLGGLAAAGALLDVKALAADKAVINMQLGWLAGGNQVGEVVAQRLGYYEQEGIDLRIQPGGPSIDGVAVVAAGRFEAGQTSSSPSVMLAVSQGIPIQCFAAGLQQHPYAFFSLAKNPIRTAQDMVGKRVGIQPTGLVLLRAVLAKNGIPEKEVKVVPLGADMAPLLTGQVDAITGWQTNTTALKPLGRDRVDLRLWDSGVRLYALPYFATKDTVRIRPEVLQRFVRATARGWLYADAHRDEAVDLLVKAYPNLNRADEREAIDVLMRYAFNDSSRSTGWGAMDPAVWQDQITQYASLGQFSGPVPKVSDVATLDILTATRSSRLRAA